MLNKEYELHLSILLQYSILKLNIISNSALLLESNFLNYFEDTLRKSFTEISRSESFADDFKSEVDDLIIDVAKDNFPQTVLSAIFSNCYNIFENQLSRICDYLYKGAKLDLKLSDINGKGYKKIKTYLQKIVRIPFEQVKDLSDRISDYSDMRNILLHRDGELKDSNIINKPLIVKEFLNHDKKHILISTKSISISNIDYCDFYKFLYENLCPNHSKEYLKYFTT